jgi:photosystem II stability/assembly factor-like uncharacterized protein
MTELLVGTKKGMFVLQGDGAAGFRVASRSFAGEPVEFATFDPRTGRTFAAAASPFFGPKLWWTEDPAGEWHQATGVQLPADGDRALERIWVVVAGEEDGLLYAGGDPGVLFESRDGGESWALNEGLWQHPTRAEWNPGGGGLCLHTIVPWPGDPSRLSVGISAVGVIHTEDGGATWRHSNRGIMPRYLPEDQRDVEHQHCVHCFRRSPARPERLFMQFHGGVYRSDDAGESWVEVGGDGLPSDFGFPVEIDPADPDSAYLIPLTADVDRVTPGGRVAVYETRDAGDTWTSRGDGLPAGDAYLTVLREAFDRSGEGPELSLWFGATSGDVFGSEDAGATWFTAATRLPPVYSVRVGRH